MSFLDRVKKVGEAIGGVITAPIGFTVDLVKAPLTDDEYGGFTDTVFRSALKHGGSAVQRLIGPEGVGGELIGAAPRPVRSAGRSALSGLETVYREGIAEPLSTAVTVSSMASRPDAGFWGDWGQILKGDNWRDAYRIAQHRSPGQAIALALGTRDIRNQSEVNKYVGSEPYKVISGVADAAIRWELDPSKLVGEGAAAARNRFVVRPLRSADDISRAMESSRVTKFVDGLEGKSAAEIRDQFFPHHAHGSVISTVLADAPDTATRRTTLAALMGDRIAFEQLRAAHAPTAAQVDRLMAERLQLVQFQHGTLFSNPDRLALVQDELDALYPAQLRAQRLEAAVTRDAALSEVPKAPTWGFGPVQVPAPNSVRTALTRSDFYQHSPLAAPLRVTFNMVPHRWVNLHSPTGDVQVARLLRESKLPVEEQDRWRSLYMAASNPTERQVALGRIEDHVVRSFADQAGMTPDELDGLLQRAARGRREAAQTVNSRAYDGKGRSRVSFVDDDGLTHNINLPLTVTQEQQFYVMPDVDKLRQATSAIGRFRLRHPNTAIPSSLIDSADHMWRTQILLRPAWPIRVVGDEQMRIVAKIGALAHMKYLRYAPGAVVEKAQRAVGKAAEKVGLIDELGPSTRLGIGERPFSYRGYDLEAAYGAPGDAANQFKHMNSSNSSWQAFAGVEDDEAQLLSHLRSRTGEFLTKAPDAPGYGTDWERAVNRQFGQDPIGKRILQGESTPAIVDWLTTTDDGRALAQRFSFRAGADPTDWVDTIRQVVDDYTLGDPGIRQAALEGKATIDDLIRVAPDAADRPLVHGEVIAQATGSSIWRDTLRGIVDKSFEALGSHPTDVLSRNPYFDHEYQSELRRLLDIHDAQSPGRLTAHQLRGFENVAREHALRQSKELLYDLAEESRLAELLKHYVPFYAAFAEVTSRWAGLAVDNPAFAARARMVWNSPEKAGIVSDEDGNIVHADGTATGPDGSKVKPGKDRYINMRLAPTLARDLLASIPGARSLANAKFNKVGFNVALSGAPSVGPLVQLPINQLALDRPDLESSLQWALPMGTTPEIRDLLLSGGVKKAWTAAEGEDSRAFVNSRNGIYDAARVDYLLGKRATPPTWAEATRKAQAFWRMRTVASFIAPVAPSFSSPYQLQIDAFRQAQTRLRDNPNALADEQGNPRTADEWFLDTYGPEFFPLTESLSHSSDGVQPTAEGFKARKKYQDLVEKHPELGGLILGNEGAGDYSGAVYDYQLTHSVRPGSGVKQRVTPSFEEHTAGPEVRLGWIEYRRFMDLVDAERVQRGLPNMQVRGAQDLAALKRAFISDLSTRNPAWSEEYGNTDRNAWTRRLAGLREIAESPAFADRADRLDIAGLREYLHARNLVLDELDKRRASTITAASNSDLAQLWESIKADIVERNLAFGALYYRWLDNDPMTLDRSTQEAAA